MKPGVLISSLLFVAGIVIMLLQLWFSLWDAELFFKIMATVTALFIVSLVLSFVYKEIADTNKLKNSKEL